MAYLLQHLSLFRAHVGKQNHDAGIDYVSREIERWERMSLETLPTTLVREGAEKVCTHATGNSFLVKKLCY
jgi:hypothetical protein